MGNHLKVGRIFIAASKVGCRPIPRLRRRLQRAIIGKVVPIRTSRLLLKCNRSTAFRSFGLVPISLRARTRAETPTFSNRRSSRKRPETIWASRGVSPYTSPSVQAKPSDRPSASKISRCKGHAHQASTTALQGGRCGATSSA